MQPEPPTRSQTDVVVQGIKTMITSGELTAGARLPIEKDLAARLGVSRGSLREGVRALALMGVVETRQGDGTYVTSLDPALLLAPMGFMIDLQAPASTAHLQSVRRVLETESAGLAAMRITDEELGRMESLLLGLQSALSDGEVTSEAAMEVDIGFHRVIAQASGNPALEALVEALASRTIRGRMWRAIKEQGAIESAQAEHMAILADLKAHEPQRARIRMAAHLLAVEEFLDAHAEEAPEPTL